MPRKSYLDINPFLFDNHEQARRASRKPFSNPLLRYGSVLYKSVDSIAEIDIFYLLFCEDLELSRPMPPLGSSRQSRYESAPYSPAFRVTSQSSSSSTHRISRNSIYEKESSDFDYPFQPHHEVRAPDSRRENLLPESLSKYQPGSHNINSCVYSAALHSNSSSKQSTFCPETDPYSTSYSPTLLTPLSSFGQLHTLRRNQSFAKRSVTLLQLENLRSSLDRETFSDELSRCSREALRITTASSPLPSLSSSLTADSFQSSITTSSSSQEMRQTYDVAGQVEQPGKKSIRAYPKRLVLGDTQYRVNAQALNISSPNPSPKYPDSNTAAERSSSYHWTPSSRSCAPTPSPAPTLTAEVSVFDPDSDDEGKKSSRLRTKLSTVSLGNLRNQSRARTDSTSRTPPMPSAPISTVDRTSDATLQRSSKGSIKARSSKESKKVSSPNISVASPISSPANRVTSSTTARTSFHSARSNHNRPSSEAMPSASPMARLQKKISVCSKRSNTADSTSTPPTPPPNTPSPPTPKLTPTAMKRQSYMSWYSCFSRAENTEAATFVAVQQQQQQQKKKKRRSTTRAKKFLGNRVRVFLERVFRPRK